MNSSQFSGQKSLIVIAGPTAVGKTELCVKLAGYLKTEIISSDSRQFFKELSIGTAKPFLSEMGGIKHHFINSLSVYDEYNAGDFERDALNKLGKIFNNNQTAILTGGSGLYIKAVCEGLNEMPKIPTWLRKSLNERFQEHGLNPLLHELAVLDPAYYQVVDRFNPQRVIRALEVCLAANKPYSFFRDQPDQVRGRSFKVIKIGLERDRKELYRRIDQRMENMIAQGLFNEAASFYNQRHLNALQTVGYKEIFDYMEGRYDKQEAIRLLKRNSRRYAKRQQTWFKKDGGTRWFHPDDFEGIVSYIQHRHSS